ncbi:DUF1990 family protein [Glutamicibacter nicotianae]|uniref:DUF1990 domain-containing protein n=1 Tax=Glutamicibacter nicotianae TaxID=37929 RepID=A0ABQ0RNC5_GLUNI|nr:DUF1990 family protein [Glutamicibacter nicotianae]GEC13309.1 hypothetical protein ANI01nite_25120 [Glutamicibacter nicotianae]
MSLTRISEKLWNPEPGRYRVWQRQAYLGSGEAFWGQAAVALLRWEVKTRSGFRISPQDKVRSGAKPQIIVPVGPVSIHEPVEVVEVLERSDVVGFAYRTLPGHPVSGEEAFILRRLGSSVIFGKPFAHGRVGSPGLAFGLLAAAGRAEAYSMALPTGATPTITLDIVARRVRSPQHQFSEVLAPVSDKGIC